jgi:hypothetical protein
MRMAILTFLLGFAAVVDAAPSRMISNVALDTASLNAVAGDLVTLTLKFSQPGIVSVVLIDRDGFVVRSLASSQPINNSFSVSWNGRDEHGDVVPDEAYSFKIDWTDGKRRDTYFPAAHDAPVVSVPARYYDRRTGTLSYVLSQPSRVHVQAGTARIIGATKRREGPVMKTIVNREPRTAGAIAEHWNGFDESGGIFLPDLKDFVVAIAAQPLPENSVVVFGNRKRSYIEWAQLRNGKSLLVTGGEHAHHGSLAAIDDVSPPLKIEPLNATWSESDRVWQVTEGSLRVRLVPLGPTATAFVAQPAKIYRFVDGLLIGSPLPKNDVVTIPLQLDKSTQRVSLNWCSDWGPVASNTLIVRQQSSAMKEALR